jgi:hypothetical protein
VFGDRLEAFVRLFGESSLRREEEICVGALVRASHASPELVHLRQPQEIGSLDDHRVDGRNVEPRLDDGRAHEHVGLGVAELEHRPFELVLVHLPVGDADARLGNERRDPSGDVVDGLDPVVDVEDLPVAQELAPDGRHHDLVVVLTHVGHDRVPVLRRGVDDGHVANAGHRHLEGARDRCRSKRQHVDTGPQRLELLLLLDTEALLLVHDHESEITELDVRL